MRTTYHLVPEAVWQASDPAAPYRATSLDVEGFIHCTDGTDALVATANRHYRTDPRPFLALTVDLDRSGARWSVEDADGIYPHLFGPLDRDAIIVVERLERDEAGRFISVRSLDPGRPTG